MAGVDATLYCLYVWLLFTAHLARKLKHFYSCCICSNRDRLGFYAEIHINFLTKQVPFQTTFILSFWKIIFFCFDKAYGHFFTS